MRTFHRMESRWQRIARRAQSGEDTVVFPNLNDKIQAARLIIDQTHTSYQTYRPNKNPPSIAAPCGPTAHTDDTPGDNEGINVVFRVKGIVTTVQTGERVTTRTNFSRDLEDDKLDNLRRLTNNVVKRQHATDKNRNVSLTPWFTTSNQ